MAPFGGHLDKTTSVVDPERLHFMVSDMKEFPVSTRYTSEELRQLDRTARLVNLSRSELIRVRSLGKFVTTHELANWAEAALVKNAVRKHRRAPRAA